MAFALKKKAEGESVNRRPAAASGAKRTTKGGKGKRFVLLIGDEGAILVYMEGKKVVRRLFAPSPQPSSTEAMVNLMQTNPKVPLYLLIDSLDQQFVRQTFPPVSSLSVGGLVKRRLERDFQPEDLKGSLFLARDKSARKEWIYLLISLAKTTLLTEWIDLVSELPNEFKGIYLVPVEAPVYLDMLNRALSPETPKSWQLLVTHNKVSGFRQVVVNSGKLVFTRVNQAIDDAIPAIIAGNIEQEIINTIEYLRRLDFAEGEGLDITVIASQDVNEALDLKRFNLGRTRALTPLDVSDALGFEQAALSADRFGDVVMAASFLRAKKHILRFSTAYADSLAKLYTAKKAMKVAAALFALVLLGLSADNLNDLQANKSATADSISKRQANQGHLDTLKKQVAGLDRNLALKSIVVSVYDVYLKNALSPVNFAASLSALLTPDQRVQTFDWQTGSASRSSTTDSKAAAPVLTGTPEEQKGQISVKAEMQFDGSYADLEALSRSEEAFLSLLSTKFPDYTVGHEPFPWTGGTDKGLEISFDEKQAVGIKEGDNHLTVTLTGPVKKKPGAAPAPGARP